MRKIQLAIEKPACSWMGRASPYSWHSLRRAQTRSSRSSRRLTSQLPSFPEAPFWCDAQLSGSGVHALLQSLSLESRPDLWLVLTKGTWQKWCYAVPSLWLKEDWLLCPCPLGRPQPPCKAGSTEKAIGRASGLRTSKTTVREREIHRPEHSN